MLNVIIAIGFVLLISTFGTIIICACFPSTRDPDEDERQYEWVQEQYAKRHKKKENGYFSF